MPATLEPEPTLSTDGVSPAELAAMESQLQALAEEDPDLVQAEAEAEFQPTALSDEPPEENPAPEPAPGDQTGTGDDTKQQAAADPLNPKPKPAEEAPKAEDVDATGKPLSKFAKNQARLERTWKSVNERKAELDKQDAELKQRAEQFARERQEWESKLAQQQTPTHTPEEYERAAAYYEQTGKLEAAEDCRAEAKRLRENPPKVVTPTAQRQALEADQRKSWEATRREIPEMFDATHPLNATMKQWLEQHGATHPVMTLPDGPRMIANVLKLKAERDGLQKVSSRVPELEQELAGLKARNQELERLVSVSGGGLPPGPTKPKRFEEMSEQEQEDVIRSAARTLG